MRAWVLLVSPFALVAVVGFARVIGQSNSPPVVAVTNPITLPVKELVLYANGLGQFRRAGEVDGAAQVQLSASASEMNDLLKSLTVDGNAENTAIVYDSQDPIENALPTYAIDLSTNPTFGELLQLARGENVVVTLNGGAGELTGAIVGMEERTESGGAKSEWLNLWTEAGARSIPLAQVRAVRFLNAKLDADVRRALALLAGNRDAGRKLLRLTLPGDGRRRVGLSYVAESPVWKASYRLVSGADGATRLQGWALIENTSSEDWNDVRVTLAGSRPVSFQMDLYPSLFVPRPIVEPEQFAALRPPAYAGPATGFGGGAQGAFGSAGGGLNLGMGAPAAGGIGGFGALGVGGGGGGQQFLGGATGFQGGGQAPMTNRYARASPSILQQQATLMNDESPETPAFQKYKQKLLDKRAAKGDEENPLRITSEIVDAPLGEPARYELRQQVNIPRLKSVIVPFMSESVTATPVSVYSPDVHETRALQAYRIKNTTGKPWVAGPVSVARGDGYAGDARMSDWPAGEERLVAFALDSGVECQRSSKCEPEETIGVRIERGQVEEIRRHRAKTQYNFRHHNGPARSLWVEHPADPHWSVVQPAKSEERTKDRFRFKLKLPVDKAANLEVVLERRVPARFELAKMEDTALRALVALAATPAAVKQALSEVISIREKLQNASARLSEARLALSEASEEQSRLRTNLERVPNGSDLQKQLMEKLSRQEATIESARQKIAAASADEKTLKEELRAKSAGLTAS